MSRPSSRRTFLGQTAGAAVTLAAARSFAAEASPASAPTAMKAPPVAPAKVAPEWPVWDESDEAAVLDVLRSGRWGRSGAANRVREFEAAFAARMKARHCIATASGTTALLTTLGALNIGPGDEVVMPAYTFVATFNSITASFALPVFADTDEASLQVDPAKMAAAITPATRLLLPVHLAGSPADLDTIGRLAKERGLTLVEDACQAPLAEWRGQPVGTTGLAGCFSFQASKNLTSGEGGAILTNDEAFANLCFNYHTPTGGKAGTTSQGRGANFRLTEFQGALLSAQLRRTEAQYRVREANASYLSEMLRQIPGIAPATLHPGCTRSGWHLYMFRYDAAQFGGWPREKFLAELVKERVPASSGYARLNVSAHVVALANNPHYVRLYGKEGMARWLERSRCPVNDRVVEQAVWLPQTKLLASRTEMERIAGVIAKLRERAAGRA